MKEWLIENWMYLAIVFSSIFIFELIKLIFKRTFRKINRKVFLPLWGKMKKLKNIDTLLVVMALIIVALIIWNLYLMFIAK